MSLTIAQGDLVDLSVDAIVSAANTRLKSSGGLAKAIATRAGKAYKDECSRAGGCRLGEVVLTSGGDLHAKYVIHVPTVNAFMRRASVAQIAASTRAALRLARVNGATSIAFPLLGTGHAGLKPTPIIAAMLEIFREAEFEELEIVLSVYKPEHLTAVKACLEVES